MAEWPANGATNWNTTMLAYLAVGHETDGTHGTKSGLQMRGDTGWDVRYTNGANAGSVEIVVDGGINDVDFSSIVPAAAKAILLSVVIKDDAVSTNVTMRKKGHTGDGTIAFIATAVAGAPIGGDYVVAVGTDGKIGASVTTGTFATVSDTLSMCVKGWWL